MEAQRPHRRLEGDAGVRDVMTGERFGAMKKGPQAEGCRWPVKARKGKEIESLPNPPEGTKPCRHLDFRLLTFTTTKE